MSGHPQRNVDFYHGLLGLRLVKVTVNYDDPGTYHLYYGDGAGNPGSIMTFFPWPSSHKGYIGAGQVGVTAFSIPKKSLDFWRKRLTDAGYHLAEEDRYGDTAILLADPDGLLIELVATDNDPRTPWDRGTVPAEEAIRGFHRVDLFVKEVEPSEKFLQEVLGFASHETVIDRTRLTTAEGGPGQIVDLVCLPGRPWGRTGGGAVHHVAWRALNDAHELEIRKAVTGAGMQATEVLDRTYFHSVYFREPGGVLYEIATDQPGFAVDEAPESLGEKLVLPAWLEARRGMLEETLLQFELPNGVTFPKPSVLR